MKMDYQQTEQLQYTTDTNLSRVSNNPSILYAFDENDLARTNQDVGFDGLKNDKEEAFLEVKE